MKKSRESNNMCKRYKKKLWFEPIANAIFFLLLNLENDNYLA